MTFRRPRWGAPHIPCFVMDRIHCKIGYCIRDMFHVVEKIEHKGQQSAIRKVLNKLSYNELKGRCTE